MILVVDDDPLVRSTIAQGLTELGYQVSEAANGKEALALLEGSEIAPQLAILDYVMPGMDGAELARRIGDVDPELPILFSTGHAALRALRTAAGESASILEKPFTLDELGALMTQVLAESRKVRT